MNKKQSGASGVGGAIGSALKDVCYFLTILFCALRACGVITWSWFWVMSPIFFSWVLALVCLGIVGLIAAIALKDD